ncbi:hypothetical protein jhhlp_001174 [Lomentospora prolificans]|uniref:Amino acid transporter transmembrane domain-containing protein n=1 Tax=Lomentospora prolificans TaxID=41688 RepID=A0A2N3NHH3_9PEZI|nr:hypothetical protein jhhlp_001174 [Lomentospora prolificans]
MTSNDPSSGLPPERDASPSRGSLHSRTDVDDSHSVSNWPTDVEGLRRRRSLTFRPAALTDIGGVNSIRSFTQSWRRAAGFAEVIPQRPPLVFAPDQAPLVHTDPEAVHDAVADAEEPPQPWTSLLRQQLDARPGPSWHDDRQTASDFRERERKAFNAELDSTFAPGSHSSSIFAVPPSLATSLVGSYPSHPSYGAIPAESERRSSFALSWIQPAEAEQANDELPPILVKEVEQDGKIMLAVEGQSTLPQTIFNSINVLIGVGLLSLPLGLKYAGWLCGMVSLFLCALVTAYTARLLGKCMDLDPSLITFSDIAYISYGRKARIATSILFTLELIAANVALGLLTSHCTWGLEEACSNRGAVCLVVLFADSMDLLFPDFLSALRWKALCVVVLLPLHFLPLRLLSVTSVIGIFSCLGIVTIVILDGLIKPSTPGSLIEPAATYLFPKRWSTLPLSFGLLLSPWGGHSVFPNIYRDMRHPYKYKKALKTTFSFTYLLDATTAAAGILMFGDDVRDSITSNILRTTGYPKVLTAFMCAFISIIPLTKIPLNARPIINTIELVCGVHYQQHPHHHSAGGGSEAPRASEAYFTLMRVFSRVLALATFLVISILFPAFDSIMAFMGSALCFTICIILPLAFYLRLFRHEISNRERLLAYILIVVCSILSLMGTVWAFLPKSLIGAD